jgi:hypothetical protein
MNMLTIRNVKIYEASGSIAEYTDGDGATALFHGTVGLGVDDQDNLILRILLIIVSEK